MKMKCPVTRAVRGVVGLLSLGFWNRASLTAQHPQATEKLPEAKSGGTPANRKVELARAIEALLEAVMKDLDKDEVRRVLKRLQPLAYDKYFSIEREGETFGRPQMPVQHLPKSADIASEFPAFMSQVQETLGEFSLLAKQMKDPGLADETRNRLLEGVVIVLEELRDRHAEFVKSYRKGNSNEHG